VIRPRDRNRCEVIEEGQQIVLCKGGNGGWGNTHFKDLDESRAQARQRRPPGERANTGSCSRASPTSGLVGFPSGQIVADHGAYEGAAKTAAYPFTTLHPQIGMIEYPDATKAHKRLLLADVPA